MNEARGSKQWRTSKCSLPELGRNGGNLFAKIKDFGYLETINMAVAHYTSGSST
jgi:hypothetical protein